MPWIKEQIEFGNLCGAREIANCRGILFEVGNAPGSRNWDDVRVFGEQPGECNLSVAQDTRLGENSKLFDQQAVGVFGVTLEAWVSFTKIIFWQFFGGDRTRQESAAERTLGDETEAKFGTGSEHVALRVACP